MSQPTLPALPSLKLPPEVATIGSMLIGLATLAATTFGVSPDATNAAVLALQYLIAAVVIIGGLVGHLHLHSQHVTLARAQMEIAGVQAASVALPLLSAVVSAPDAQPVPPPPATDAPVSPSYAPPAASQPAPGDTPTQVVAKVADVPLASAQAATDSSAT